VSGDFCLPEETRNEQNRNRKRVNIGGTENAEAIELREEKILRLWKRQIRQKAVSTREKTTGTRELVRTE
jgi:hypothetical protein